MASNDDTEGQRVGSADSAPANTRREFLGATAGAGLAGSFLNGDELSPDDIDLTEEQLDDPELAATAMAESDGVFDIRDFGAVGDGETDNTTNVQDAVDAAGEWGNGPEQGGTVLVPPGDFRMFTTHLWDKHNGITITGVGYSSKLKALLIPEDHPRNNTDGVGDHYRIFSLNPSYSDGLQPDGHENDPYQNITIQNLHLEGVKDELYEHHGERDIYSGRGIETDEDGLDHRNIVYQNLWTNNWDTVGVECNADGMIVDGVRAWNNDSHGVSTQGENAIINNVIAWQNGGYGIDVHGGENFQITNYTAFDNDFGLKVSTGSPDFQLTNAYIFRNWRKGFQMTGSDRGKLRMSNVEFRENGGRGLHVHASGDLYLSNVRLVGNLYDPVTKEEEGGPSDAEYANGIYIYNEGDDNKVVANNLLVEGNHGNGFLVEGPGGELRASNFEAVDNEGVGLVQEGGPVVISDGEFHGNDGTGMRVEGGPRTVVKGVRLEDDVGIEIQGDAGHLTLRDIDARESSTPVDLADGVDAVIENVAGFPTAATGTTEFSGGGSQKLFTVEHGLAVAPEYVNAVADSSTDATTVQGVRNVDDTSFDIEFATPPSAGFLDEENVAVHWEASAF